MSTVTRDSLRWQWRTIDGASNMYHVIWADSFPLPTGVREMSHPHVLVDAKTGAVVSDPTWEQTMSGVSISAHSWPIDWHSLAVTLPGTPAWSRMLAAAWAVIQANGLTHVHSIRERYGRQAQVRGVRFEPKP